MKTTIIVITTILSSLSWLTPVRAENLDHLRQLLATKQCPQCDLTGSGLVLGNLAGANLAGANLTGANLSQANLTGAILIGANLTGASLNGANLTGANLTGAIVNGTDLRNSYLTHANLTGVVLNNAYVQGAKDLDDSAQVSPELLYSWGLVESQKGNYNAAIQHYTKAVTLKPDYAPAYLARGMAYFRLGNVSGATQDAQTASQLFQQQENPAGYQVSENFIQGIELAQKDRKVESTGNFQQVVQTVGSLLLKFFLP